MKKKHSLNREKTFNSLWGLIFMIYFCLGIMPVNINNLLLSLPGTTKLGIGICSISYLFVTSISLLLFGYYEDKITEINLRKKLFIFTNLIWVIVYGFIFISPNFQFYLLFIIIGAIGIGAFVPIGYSIISDFYSPKERGKKYGSINSGLILGTGAGILVGGFLGNYAGPNGWRFAYAIGFIFGLLTVFNFILKAEDPKRGQAEPEFKDFEENFIYDYKINIKRIGLLLRRKSVSSILIYTLFSGIAVSTISYWGIFYLTLRFNGIFEELSATALYLLTGVGVLPGTLLGGKFGDFLYHSGKIRGRIYLSVLGLISGIVCLMIFYLLPISATSQLEITIFWIILFIIGFCGYFLVSLSIGNVFAIYSEVNVPEARSAANSLHQVMINTGGIFGNLVFAGLIERNISLLPNAMFFLFLFWLIGTSLWIIAYTYYPIEFKKIRELMFERKKELELNLN
ncbi:MAG: MFS transporter [Promethearchaeota archaeon]